MPGRLWVGVDDTVITAGGDCGVDLVPIAARRPARRRAGQRPVLEQACCGRVGVTLCQVPGQRQELAGP
ncbi:MAG TPA: hypothetical protein VGI05_10615, partial [Streptosporangiaceae bacterium]